MKNFLKIRGWELLLLFLFSLVVLLPISPLNMPSTYRDSGVFLYTGWRILNGDIPYRDVWDHKPPVIFYLNALGLIFSQNSRWGVWFIEFLFLFTAAWIGFRLIQKMFGDETAILSSLLWLSSLIFVLDGGNLTEEYALPIQFAALYLISKSDESEFMHLSSFLLGLLGGMAFLTKQTAIGIWIAILVYLFVSRIYRGQIKRLIRELCLIASGGFVVILGWVLFLVAQGALLEFWEAVFRYNLIYTSSISELSIRLGSIIYGARLLSQSGLFPLSIVGYVLGIILFLERRNAFRGSIAVLFVGLLDLPLELIFAGASGRSYPHYYMTLLPVLFLLTAVLLGSLNELVSVWRIGTRGKSLFIVLLVVVFLVNSFLGYKDYVKYLRGIDYREVSNYIRSNSDSDDFVLLWGAEAGVNFAAQRRSPSRFVYQYPLYMRGYVNEQIIEEFLGDVIRKRPRLIIDTHNPETPFYDFPIQTDTIMSRIEYLKTHYRYKGEINGWTVYEFDDGLP